MRHDAGSPSPAITRAGSKRHTQSAEYAANGRVLLLPQHGNDAPARRPTGRRTDNAGNGATSAAVKKRGQARRDVCAELRAACLNKERLRERPLPSHLPRRLNASLAAWRWPERYPVSESGRHCRPGQHPEPGVRRPHGWYIWIHRCCASRTAGGGTRVTFGCWAFGASEARRCGSFAAAGALAHAVAAARHSASSAKRERGRFANIVRLHCLCSPTAAA